MTAPTRDQLIAEQVEAERRAVVGCWNGGQVAERLFDLTPDSFCDWAARAGFEALQRLRTGGRELTFEAVLRSLQRKPQGQEAYTALRVAEDEWGPVTGGEVLEAVERVKEAARRRRLALLGQVAQAELDPERRTQALREIQTLLDPDPSAWPDPALLQGDGSLPSFPVDVLPMVLRDFVAGLSEAYQVPADLPAWLTLAAVAACAQGRFQAQASPDWIVPVNLFCAVSMESGTRKSPVARAAQAPLLAYERRVRGEARTRILALEQKIRLKKSTLEIAEKQAQKGGPGATSVNGLLELASELSGLQEQLEEAQPQRLLIGGDITVERLAAVVASNRERGAIIDSEGSFLDHLFGIYGKGGANLDFPLKAYDGDPVEVGRVKREGSCMEHPVLTLGMAVQPCSLEDLFGLKRLRGRGLVARIIFACPRTMVGRRSSNPEPLSESARQKYEDAILWLLSEPGQVLRLTAEARLSLMRFQEELEPRLGPGGDLETLADWASKLAGTCLRLAAIFHLLDSPGQRVDRSIPLEPMERACRLARSYMIEHASAAFAIMGVSAANADARFILRLLAERADTQFKARDLLVWARRRFGTMEPIREALALLEDYGWIRSLDSGQRERGPGRPASVFLVHPQLSKHFSTGARP